MPHFMNTDPTLTNRLGPTRDDRGMSLVLVLLALVVISVAAAAFMMLSNVETKVAGHDVRASQSLNIAEAGISEAVSRIRSGDVPNNSNPKMVTQIFLANPGDVPVLGTDSTALGTSQQSTDWLAYSMPRRDPRVLTITYKTDPARTKVYRYDPSKDPAVQTSTGLPVFHVSSIGRKGLDQRRIETDLVMKPMTILSKAAIACEQGINFTGSAFTCGYNHGPDTPAGTEGAACKAWEVGPSSLDKPGAWSTMAVDTSGASVQNGYPVATAEHQTGFFAGPWQCLGMSQSEFFQWVGNPAPSEVQPPKGIIYLDNNGVTQDHSGTFAYHGGTGEGFLYVDGDLAINSNFVYRGLIYIEGDLKINGDAWILGGLVVKGKTTIKIANGSCAVLYSDETIKQKITRYGGQLVTLSWIETN
jgi:Tfp pilus assembly protein PilV